MDFELPERPTLDRLPSPPPHCGEGAAEPHRDPADLAVPDAAFVQHIDVLLQKDDPRITIPWRRRPAWARPDSVRHMVDIGAGVGRFTQSVINVLARWRVLSRTPDIRLLDGDPALFSDLGVPGTRTVEEVCDAVLKTATEGGVRPRVQYDRRNAALQTAGDLFPLNRKKPVDLIVASHVSYYFADGSGLDFARACSKHLAPGGLLWLVIRRMDCPIYRSRAKTLCLLGHPDPKPFDYAEHFLRNVPKLRGQLKLVAHATQNYDLPPDPVDRLTATHLLMWRDYPGPTPTQYASAARFVAEHVRSPFAEEHILLTCA